MPPFPLRSSRLCGVHSGAFERHQDRGARIADDGGVDAYLALVFAIRLERDGTIDQRVDRVIAAHADIHAWLLTK